MVAHCLVCCRVQRRTHTTSEFIVHDQNVVRIKLAISFSFIILSLVISHPDVIPLSITMFFWCYSDVILVRISPSSSELIPWSIVFSFQTMVCMEWTILIMLIILVSDVDFLLIVPLLVQLG